ncbi:MAG TPA: thiamine-phosphate kinase, partial [Terriglobia bacterium]|nr:thiamine-phosphate kinase [Terriglobia bacterium]
LGGDTARHSGGIFADIVLVGEVPQGKALLRSGAKPGDALFVAGTLGLSARGLEFLRSGKRSKNSPAFREALRAHAYPEPQCHLGQYLAKTGLAAAAIDLSDGLSTDLGRLCQSSGVGAKVWAERIPVPPDFSTGNPAGHSHLFHLALHGGEDYKLLFAVRPGNVARVPDSFEGVRIHRIGEVLAGPTKSLVLPNGAHKRLESLGYDHFRTSQL